MLKKKVCKKTARKTVMRKRGGTFRFLGWEINRVDKKKENTIPERFRGVRKGQIYTDKYIGWISPSYLKEIGKTRAKRKYGFNKLKREYNWGQNGYGMWK